MEIKNIKFTGAWLQGQHKWSGEDNHLLLKAYRLQFHTRVQLLTFFKTLQAMLEAGFLTLGREIYEIFNQRRRFFTRQLLDNLKVQHIF